MNKRERQGESRKRNVSDCVDCFFCWIWLLFFSAHLFVSTFWTAGKCKHFTTITRLMPNSNAGNLIYHVFFFVLCFGFIVFTHLNIQMMLDCVGLLNYTDNYRCKNRESRAIRLLFLSTVEMEVSVLESCNVEFLLSVGCYGVSLNNWQLKHKTAIAAVHALYSNSFTHTQRKKKNLQECQECGKKFDSL